MESITKNINANLDGAGAPIRIWATQGDRGTRYLRATMLYGSEVVAIASTSTATISARRPDCSTKTFEATINGDGTITAPLNGWMLEQSGDVTCNISVAVTENEEQKRLTSAAFIVMVGRSASSGESISEDESYDVLLTLIDSATTATASASTAASAATTAAQSANTAATAATTAAKNANTATTNAKTATTNAAAATTAAQTATTNANTATTAANDAAKEAAAAAKACEGIAAGINTIADTATGKLYTIGVESGLVYLEEVES